MKIEISQPSKDYIRLAVLGENRGEAAQFRLALMSQLGRVKPEATSIDIPAIGWLKLCQRIERHLKEEYDFEQRACESMAEKGYGSRITWPEPLTWSYARRTYQSIAKIERLIPTVSMQAFDLGTFTVDSNGIRVTDPCYEIGTWCAGVITDVQPGTWCAQSVMSDEGAWGARVKQLCIRHADVPSDIFKTATFSKTEIDVGVDSGQVGFFDADRYPTDPSELEYEPGRFYGNCCELTLDRSRPGGGVIPQGFGVVTSSGYGDGSYSCYVTRNAEGQVIAAFVTFIGDAEDEEEVDE